MVWFIFLSCIYQLFGDIHGVFVDGLVGSSIYCRSSDSIGVTSNQFHLNIHYPKQIRPIPPLPTHAFKPIRLVSFVTRASRNENNEKINGTKVEASRSNNNDSSETRYDSNTNVFEPPISPFDVRKEDETSKKLFQRLSIVDTVGKAWNVALYGFVGLGYAYKPTGTLLKIEVGTLQERQFQLELNKQAKQKPQQQQHQPLDQSINKKGEISQNIL